MVIQFFLWIHKTQPLSQAAMRSSGQAKKKPHRNIRKQPNFGFVALLSSEGHKEFGDRAEKGQLVISLQTTQIVRAAELLQNLELRAWSPTSQRVLQLQQTQIQMRLV